jgi:hypothetical protein
MQKIRPHSMITSLSGLASGVLLASRAVLPLRLTVQSSSDPWQVAALPMLWTALPVRPVPRGGDRRPRDEVGHPGLSPRLADLTVYKSLTRSAIGLVEGPLIVPTPTQVGHTDAVRLLQPGAAAGRAL